MYLWLYSILYTRYDYKYIRIFCYVLLITVTLTFFSQLHLRHRSYLNSDIGSEEKGFGSSPVYDVADNGDPYLDDLEHELESSIANSIQLQAAVEPK